MYIQLFPHVTISLVSEGVVTRSTMHGKGFRLVIQRPASASPYVLARPDSVVYFLAVTTPLHSLTFNTPLLREADFCSRQLMITQVDGRAGANKEMYDTSML